MILNGIWLAAGIITFRKDEVYVATKNTKKVSRQKGSIS